MNHISTNVVLPAKTYSGIEQTNISVRFCTFVDDEAGFNENYKKIHLKQGFKIYQRVVIETL